MRRRQFTSGVMAGAALGLCRTASARLVESDAAAGVRAALERGAIAAVSALGRADGFLGNPRVRIGLPGALDRLAGLLKAAGQGALVDELVVGMNRAAETAVPQGRAPLVDALQQMSVDDALRIVRGSDTAVTAFFERKTRDALADKFLPVVTKAIARVALAPKLDALLQRGARLGLTRGNDVDLSRYVTGRTLDGLYRVIGDEERKIRRDPAATGSAILARVFGR
jgi:hypothetical protein